MNLGVTEAGAGAVDVVCCVVRHSPLNDMNSNMISLTKYLINIRVKLTR